MLSIKYRVPCADDDKANELLAIAPGGKLPEHMKGKGWKWVHKSDLPQGFLQNYEWGLLRTCNDGRLDYHKFISVFHNVPFYPDAECVIVDFVFNQMGTGNGFPRAHTTFHLALEFKNGVPIKGQPKA